MEFFLTKVNGLKPLTTVTKSSTLYTAGFLHTPLKVFILFMHRNIVTHLMFILSLNNLKFSLFDRNEFLVVFV